MKSIKQKIREEIWEKMEKKGVTRFPTPVKGRIPNFKAAKKASEKLAELKVFKDAESVKVNPDSPQHPVRTKASKEGKTLYMPTPRLKNGFLEIKPENIPKNMEKKATTIKHSNKYGEKIDPEKMPQIDLIIAGSVAVNKKGARIGKGAGYSDLEYAILQETGQKNPPVATTVHEIQIIKKEIPVKTHDTPLNWITTPERKIKTKNTYKPPTGINWNKLEKKYLKQIPLLKKLKNKNRDKQKN